jgi:large subunit ribosomal protein L24
MKLRPNDQVIITAGKDKDQKGKVTKVFTKEHKLIVEGLNKYKRHLKKRSAKEPGGIVAIERPLPMANVALICPSCKKPTRVGYQILKTGEKIRICKKCQSQIDKQAK